MMTKDFVNFLKAKYKGLEITKGKKLFTINIEKLEKTFWEKIFFEAPSTNQRKILEDLHFYYKGYFYE